MRLFKIILTGILLTGLACAAGAGEGKIKGYMFGDYYYVVSADDGETKMPEKQNAFQFRRVYFTYDKDINDTFSIRYRLEAKDAGFADTDKKKMVPFTKIAQLKWKKGLAGCDVLLGLTGTPTWTISEKVWGYRSIEKTILDLNKIGSSADIGVGLKGKSGKLGYRLMLGNGPGQKPENDNGKKIYAQAAFQVSEALQLEGYADFNMQPQDQNQLTVKGLVGVVKENFHGGVEPFVRIHQKAGQAKKLGDDVTITGVSAYGALKLTEKQKAFGRVDAVSNNDTDATNLLVLAGVDHMPAKNVHLMPNIRVELPDGPDPNIQARLTFFYVFK